MKHSKHAMHAAAAQGYRQSADQYAQGRPDYPSDISAWLSEQLGLRAGTTVVDLGAGTGKFTSRLLETGAQVIAIEPVVEMRNKLSAAFPLVEALEGIAETIPLPDASVDAVVCAQAFHWFATTEALTEIHRILKPGGRLGLIWNVRDERVGWVAELGRITNRHEGDAPRYHTGDWRKVFPFAGFGPLQEAHFSHRHSGTAEDVVINRVKSVSFIAALPAEERAKVEAQLRDLIAGTPELEGRELVTMPYRTDAFFMVKI